MNKFELANEVSDLLKEVRRVLTMLDSYNICRFEDLVSEMFDGEEVDESDSAVVAKGDLERLMMDLHERIPEDIDFYRNFIEEVIVDMEEMDIGYAELPEFQKKSDKLDWSGEEENDYDEL